MQIQLNPKQFEFVEAPVKYTLYSGGLGCMRGDTLVQTRQGPQRIDSIQGPQEYLVYDGINYRWSLGTAPFQKGVDVLYRVTHDRGEFVAHGSHRFAVASNEYLSVEQLSLMDSSLYPALLCSTEESYRQGSVLDVLHSMQRVSDSLNGYLQCSHLYGLPLHEVEDTCPRIAPLLDDARLFFHFCGSHLAHKHMDVLEELQPKHNQVHQQSCLDKKDSLHHIALICQDVEALLAELLHELSHTATIETKLYQLQSHKLPQLEFLLSCLQKLNYELGLLKLPYNSPLNSQILQVERLSTPEAYYDISVPIWHNYVLADGTIHHNSGKSYALASWIIYNALRYPTCIGLITANTYKQLRRATLTTLFNMLDDLQIKFTYKSTGELLIGKHLIYCMSMEQYDTLRGIEVGYWAADEFSFYKPEAVNVAMGRLRDKRGPLQLKAASTPQGFNFAYEMFVTNANPHTHIVFSSSRENKHLPSQYVTSLEQQYDAKLTQQELDGKFVNIQSGQVYYGFDRTKHLRTYQPSPSAFIVAGVDFNVNPITAALAYVDGQHVHVFDEIFMNDSNTYALAEALKPFKPFQVCPDSTGGNRKTSSTRTDHQILREAGLPVTVTPNPHVKDRYNCINGLFAHNRISIDPKCKYLIRDLEQMTYENNDPMISHISDAFGYLVWKHFPLTRPVTPSRSFIR